MAGVIKKAMDLVLGEDTPKQEKTEVKQPPEPPQEPDIPTDDEAEDGDEVLTEEEPMRSKSLELDEIAVILGIRDVKSFCELYEKDLMSWKDKVDTAYDIRKTDLEDMMSKLEMFNDDPEEKDNFTSRAYKIAELLVRFTQMDLNNRDAVIAWKNEVRQTGRAAAVLMKTSSDYEKVLTDYLNVLNANQCAMLFYEEARDEIIANLQEDNIKFAEIIDPLQKALDSLKDIMEEYDEAEPDVESGDKD